MNPAEAKMNMNNLTGTVIGAAIEVHKQLGPGLLESVYEECLCHELKQRNINFERQKTLTLQYKDVKLECGYRLDIVVEGMIILERHPSGSATHLFETIWVEGRFDS